MDAEALVIELGNVIRDVGESWATLDELLSIQYQVHHGDRSEIGEGAAALVPIEVAHKCHIAQQAFVSERFRKLQKRFDADLKPVKTKEPRQRALHTRPMNGNF